MSIILDENFTELNIYIRKLKPTQLLILVDENTHEYCLPILLGNLETEIPFEIIEIEAGEEMKTLETASQLWEILTEFKTDRNALMINLGGGVITDLGGFIASTYKRGIKFINIPTTLLAMCDAAIGGKTGIDHLFLKNIIGTFAHAEQLFVYPQFLKTLPYEQLRSGFAEMLKHGLIADKNHWNDLISIKDLSAAAVLPFVQTSIAIKEKVVELDFREENIRKTLNFGHTIGHAFESLFLQSNNTILHGEAVALGMICEAHLSFSENLITKSDLSKIVSGINHFFPMLNIEMFSLSSIMELMMNDKKNSEGKIKFSLLTKVGSCNFDYEVSIEKITDCIEFYKNLPNTTETHLKF